MPVLGFYRVTFTHDTNEAAQMSIELEVGDGEHPPSDRARERLVAMGVDMRPWSEQHVEELPEPSRKPLGSPAQALPMWGPTK
jgi:hypothetical protein